jgi:NADPH-dependent 2,4-dienoyl-CoA reductase/sulfur reductase-like enzyme/rhodanese-related sulfurtransferase
MNSSKNIVVIGGVACGPKSAARARRRDTDAKITVIEQGDTVSYASCGLPYYVSGMIQRRNALLVRSAKDFKNIADIDVMLNTRVEGIDRSAHELRLTDVVSVRSSTIQYDKLVVATGATPVRPQIEGLDLNGVFSVKDVSNADSILAWVTSVGSGRAVIVGAGLIGMEMADVLMARGLSVTVVEALNGVLPGALDEEISAPLAGYLRKKGLDLRLGERVVRFEGEEGKVRRVVTQGGIIDADVVIMAIGVRPNVTLAREAGLTIGSTGAISVNEMLQTNDPDIYAGGDCVENRHLVTGARVCVPMGSTANKHGRVIGTNITGGHDTFPGVLGTTMVKAFDYHVGRTGLGEKEARAAGFDVVTSLVPAFDHARYYPGAREVLLKVIADRKTGRVLGGQGMGRGELAKRIDVLATTIKYKGTVEDLADLDLGYAPQYNTPQDPVHHAANTIRNKIEGLADSLSPVEVKARMDGSDDCVIIDVREQREWDTWHIESPRVMLIPQSVLLPRLDELPRDKEIILSCRGGGRAYQSARMLKGAGFKNVRFAEGSLVAWPYECFGGDKD